MVPCPGCGCHARRTDARCPCCGARIGQAAGGRTAAMALLGLAMACSGKEGDAGTTGDTGTETTPTAEPLYGVTVTTSDPTDTDTDTDADPDSGGSGSWTGGSGG